MKKALIFLAQCLLFFIVLFAGTLLDPLHLRWFVSHPTLTSTRFFVPDGVILMTLLVIVILAGEAATKRFRGAGAVTAAAYAVTLILGMAVKVGWATHDLF
jgi:hypothetical protein